MARSLAEFVDHFVLPLLGGGDLHVAAPIRQRERDLWLEETSVLGQPDLAFVRLRRAQELVAQPDLPDTDADELSLWVGLHNALVFDHPDRRRVWSRASMWRRVEGITRAMLSLPSPQRRGETIARHLSVGALVDVTREDLIFTTAAGEVRSVGRDPSRRKVRNLGLTDGVLRQETVRWVEFSHSTEAERLLEDALRASPLTCVLHPLLAPPGWSPLLAAEAFGDPPLVRAICHTWAGSTDWIAIGGAVAAALLPSVPDIAIEISDPGSTEDLPLALPGAVLPTDPEVLAGIVGALIHLHFLKVLELDARLGIAAVTRDRGVTAFLALPLLLPWLHDVMGEPLGGLAAAGPSPAGRDSIDAPLARRWAEYLDHLRELVPRSATDKLLASLVPRIVQTP